MSMPSDELANAVAIVGMSCRLPGAASVDAFWSNLVNGVESITRFSDEELEDSFPPEVRSQPNFVRARPILDDVDQFDAAFFGMLPREATLVDPQHRLFIECAWEAIEQAGYVADEWPGLIGVFAGCSMPTYLMRNVLGDHAVVDNFTSEYQVGCYPELMGAGQDFLATRVSYKLNLRGPSMTLQTACSTSLTAMAMACQSLLLHQADMALAGGSSITFPQKRGYRSQEGGMVSEDGHCRPFDVKANGTIFGSGVGVVLLKRLEDAIEDGDHIWALIRGCGINNDGSGKIAFTAPSPDGQAEAIAMAYAAAEVDPATVSYVECHGTATPLGDPIEIQGLSRVFGGRDDTGPRCAIGSVKGNIGHLDAAAGAAGVIKTALALRRETIPSTLNFTEPNPHLAIDETPFFVAGATMPWPRADAPRRAGVSALGVGGTNVHVVLEEAPEAISEPALRPEQLLVLSARSESALEAGRIRLADHLESHPELPLADVAHTLQVGRKRFEHRAAVACSDTQSAVAALRGTATLGARAFKAAARDRPQVAFLFPGQGSQRPGMGRTLFETEPVFRHEMERAADLLAGDWNLIDLIYNGKDGATAAEVLRQTEKAQPAIFALEHALGRMMLEFGIRPDLMIGHSVGEFVAACLAGVMEFEDALELVVLRGRLMQDLPPGRMLSVRADAASLREILPEGAEIAAVNAPKACVASGPADAIAELERRLEAGGIVSRALQASHAFHSAMMEPMVEPLAARMREIALKPPQLRYISTATGDWITPELATDPAYWARHARQPVLFADAIATAIADGEPTFLELGAGEALASLTRAQTSRSASVVACLPSTDLPEAGSSALAALGQLWVAGCEPEWTALQAGAKRLRVPLPTYPFERSRYFIDARRATAAPGDHAAASAARAAGFAADPDLDSISGGLQMTIAQKPEPSGESGRQAAIRRHIVDMFDQLSGQDIAEEGPETTFLQMGFDSLFLTQVTQEIQKQFDLKVSFRELLGDLGTVPALTDFLADKLPATAFAPEEAQEPVATPVFQQAGPAAPTAVAVSQPAPQPAAQVGAVATLMQEQLNALSRLMEQQLNTLGGQAAPTRPAVAPQAVAAQAAPSVEAPSPAPARDGEIDKSDLEKADAGSRFNVYKPSRAAAASSQLDERQKRFITDLTAHYTTKTAASKAYAQKHRAHLADPRAASGFNTDWKELVYPIVADVAKGSHIRDLDGNDYVDIVNGYGQTMFGHSPDFVVEAVREQMERGFPIGPQAGFAGEVADLFCAMTGHDRTTFCNTGSEAVMAAMRVARAVTGRARIVSFQGDYHGQFEEVLVKGVMRKGEPRTLPAVVGVQPEAVANMIVLPYGTDEALEWIRAHANELAGVIVEPVQSRHCDLRPAEFLREIRRITAESGTAFIFDEIVTGFRVHQRGMQGIFGIDADMATYGKVLGGGMPIGVLAGKSRFMDALDGGYWQFGDDSFPETGVTFFAGTFVRHPLVLAAVRACLLHMQADPDLQERVAGRAERLVAKVREAYRAVGATPPVEAFSSLFYIRPTDQIPYQSLLFYLLREKGVYAHEGFPCFVTTAHTEEDCERIAQAFRDSLLEMARAGFTPLAADSEDLMPMPTELQPTQSQHEIWLSAQLGAAASCAFNESVSIGLKGPLDTAALGTALDTLSSRHEILRARFSADGTALRIAEDAAIALDHVDLSGEPDGQAAFERLVAEDARTPFDLVNGPVWRVRLARLADDNHVLLMTAHHIVCDGWSINVMLDELARLYTAERIGKPADIEAPASFARYAGKVNADPARAADEAYWLERFQAVPPALELPVDRPRPARKTFAGGSLTVTIDAVETQAVKKSGARHGATLFTTLLTTLQVLFGRLAGQSDVVVGVPAAEQSVMDDQRPFVGHCVNFLPMRASWDPKENFLQVLKRNSAGVLEAYEHQRCTLGTLIQKLNLRKDPSRLPLVEVQFNLERLSDDLEFTGLQTTVTPNPKSFSTFDVYVNVVEGKNGLSIECTYNTDLFDRATMVEWMELWRHLLSEVAADPDRSVASLPLIEISDVQASRLIGPALDLPASPWAHELIMEQIARRGAKQAVRAAGETLTYTDLGRRSDQLARALQDKGVQPGQCVGVCVTRSVKLPVILLGIWKAGACYLPLSPSDPKARRDLILAEAGIAAYVTDGANAKDGPVGVATLDIDKLATKGPKAEPLPWTLDDPDPLAYIIYTSGSTGKPKGVEVRHRAVVNFLLSMRERPGFSEDDVLLAVTTMSFDIAVLELFLPLVAGGCVEIASAAQARDGFELLSLLGRSQATVMQATPVTWRMLIEAGFVAPARFKMLCGGEALPADLSELLLDGDGELWNMYGPTETTVWSSLARISDPAAPIVVGDPIANTDLCVLDDNDEIVPSGVLGQLHIGGAGLARGYRRREDLTGRAFVERGPGKGGRLYRTGDLARILSDGSVHLAGRIDRQVKLRGFRIELGEIEAALSKVGLGACAVTMHEDGQGNRTLAAYYQAPSAEATDHASVRTALATLIPEYMIPGAFVRLDRLPLGPSGKIDWRALPAVEMAARPVPSGGEIEADASDEQRKLASIVAESLGLESLSIHDDLMALGADSLGLFRIVSKARAEGITIAASDLFERPTVAGALKLAGSKAADVSPIRKLSRLPRAREAADRNARQGIA